MSFISDIFGGGSDVPSPPAPVALPPPPVILPPPPTEQEILDVFDELNGVQSIVITQPNGRKVRRTTRLPRTPEQERIFKIGERIMGEGLPALQYLFQKNPSAIVSATPVINAIAGLNEKQAQELSQIADFGNIQQDIQNFTNVQQQLFDRELMRGRNRLETDLARRGRSGGSYGAAQRAYFENEAALGRAQNDINALQYGEALAERRLSRNLKAYDARQEGRENQVRGAQMEYGLKRQEQNDLEAQRQRNIENQMNLFQLGSNIVAQDQNRATQSNANQLALQEFGLRNQAQMGRYNADTANKLERYRLEAGALNNNYQNQLAYNQALRNAENQKGGSFGQLLGNIGGLVGSSMLFGPTGSGGNKLFTKLFG